MYKGDTSVDSIGEFGRGHGQLVFPAGLALVRGSGHGGFHGAHTHKNKFSFLEQTKNEKSNVFEPHHCCNVERREGRFPN